MSTVASAIGVRRSRVRLLIVTLLFLVTTVNYADRATLSIAGTALAKDLSLDPVAMGYIFSAFGWSHVAAQAPGGWLLDRFGSKWVYAFGILIWSFFTLLQGMVGFFTGATAVAVLFLLRLLIGLAEAPSFPANARIVAAWFPGNERGTASAFFNSGQYFATVIFAPLMGWIAHDFGWPYVFYVMGALGVLVGIIWIKMMYGPKDHPGINEAEFDYIRDGSALVDLDASQNASGTNNGPKWNYIGQLLSNRMILGVYIGQFCIHLAKGSRRRLRRVVQHVRQPLQHHDPDHHRLCSGSDGIVQRCIGICRRQRACCCLRLPRDRGQDRTGEAADRLKISPGSFSG
jgi:MFS transporter, ACS family, glucarate transporter